MAENTLAFGDTIRLDNLGGGSVTPPQCATSIPIPAELANAIAKEIEQSPSTQLTSTCPIADDSATGAFRRHVISRVDDTAAASDVTTTQTPDAHFQTLRATRIRKIPDAASAAAVPDRTKQRAENSTMVRRWSSQHKSMASVPDVLPLSQTGQATWITACPSELEALVRAAFPCAIPIRHDW